MRGKTVWWVCGGCRPDLRPYRGFFAHMVRRDTCEACGAKGKVIPKERDHAGR